MKTTWTNILSKMQEILLEADYSVWIQPLEGTIVCLDSLVQIDIVAKNSFVANYVRLHYSQQFAKFCSELMELPNDVEIKVNIQAAKSIDEKKIKSIDMKEFTQSLPTAPAILATSQEQLLLPISNPINFTQNKFKYSFDEFVIGSSNKLAFAAAETMLHEQAPASMLFLSSQSGLGKTHLMHSVGKSVCASKNKNFAKVAYLSAEQFTSQFVRASQFRHLSEFKDYFRSLDLLLLEDVHFLQGKEKTQEELLATIKCLHDKGSRVILTSSFLPKEIVGLDSNLISHFHTGFLASIEKPDMDTRLHILMDKAKKQSFNLPNTIAELIASRIIGDVRILEGCLQTLVLKSQLLKTKLTENLALEVIESVICANPKYDFETIVKLICKCFNITDQQLKSTSRKQELVAARNTIYFLLRKHTEMTLEQIGSRFNRRHSSVIKGISNLECEISKESSKGRQMKFIISKIEQQCQNII